MTSTFSTEIIAEQPRLVTDSQTFQYAASDRSKNTYRTCQASFFHRCSCFMEQSAGWRRWRQQFTVVQKTLKNSSIPMRLPHVSIRQTPLNLHEHMALCKSWFYLIWLLFLKYLSSPVNFGENATKPFQSTSYCVLSSYCVLTSYCVSYCVLTSYCYCIVHQLVTYLSTRWWPAALSCCNVCWICCL